MSKVLDGTSSRHRVLANNIANAETPGYTRKDISFEDQLTAAITTHNNDPKEQKNAIDQVPVRISEDAVSPRRNDGNNVNIEREMATLAKNTLQYEIAAQYISRKFSGLRKVIFEGRG